MPIGLRRVAAAAFGAARAPATAGDTIRGAAVPLPVDFSEPVVSCSDRWHRRVVAREHRRHSHVVAEHPEMTGGYGEVEAAIRDPEFVNFDATRPHTEVFYRTIEPPNPYAGYYCKVVVRYGRESPAGSVADGEVVTAFVTNRVRKGEQRKWPEIAPPPAN